MTTAERTCMISASKSAICCHFLMISEGTRARVGMVSSSLIFQQVETPFARPARQISGKSPMMSASSGTEIRNFLSPQPSASLRVGSSPRCPQDWKMLSRISAEPEGQIPLAHIGDATTLYPPIQRAFQSLRNGRELDRRLAQVLTWHMAALRYEPTSPCIYMPGLGAARLSSYMGDRYRPPTMLGRARRFGSLCHTMRGPDRADAENRCFIDDKERDTYRSNVDAYLAKSSG
jgi:hypothetical protein